MAQPPIKANKVSTLEMPWRVLVIRADPDFEASRRKEPFYEFTRRKFDEDTSRQGPYSTVPNKRD